MSSRHLFAWFVAATITTGSASGNSHRGGGSHPVHLGGGGPNHSYHHSVGSPLGGGAGWSSYGFPCFGGSSLLGSSYFAPPVASAFPVFLPVIVDNGILGGPMPPPQLQDGPGLRLKRAKRVDPIKASQLVTFGDRLFRAGNLKRASERYEQAIRADPEVASPRIGLAQVALLRGQFKESAAQIRSAVAAEPGWLAKAPDIQTIYAEPADFTRQISRLESHILIEPGDRDAWLVLGAQLYLSGQTRRAADIFVRLTDREPDPTLAAFLKASSPR